ncbi:MAG: hypothetical protein ABI615_04295 [Chthoniobacterales bacterium]
MTKTLKRIEPLQAGKMFGALYALLSLIFVAFLLFFAVLGLLVPSLNGSVASAGFGMIGVIIIAIFVPVLYGVAGFIAGVICAWLYNIIAGVIGGIRFEVD